MPLNNSHDEPDPNPEESGNLRPQTDEILPTSPDHRLRRGRLDRDCRRHRKEAIETFKKTFSAIAGGSSGQTIWNLKVSARPGDWRLRVTYSTGSPFKNSTRHKQNCEINARFSPQILGMGFDLSTGLASHADSDLYELPFDPAVLHTTSDFILLGFYEIERSMLADKVFQAHLAIRKDRGFRPALRWVMQKDGFECATHLTHPARADHVLTEHIRKRVLDRITQR